MYLIAWAWARRMANVRHRWDPSFAPPKKFPNLCRPLAANNPAIRSLHFQTCDNFFSTTSPSVAKTTYALD